jgi:hypothetical protein
MDGRDEIGLVRVTLRPLPGAVPAAVRLRRALKCLLRAFALRCTALEVVPAGPDLPVPPAEAGPAAGRST